LKIWINETLQDDRCIKAKFAAFDGFSQSQFFDKEKASSSTKNKPFPAYLDKPLHRTKVTKPPQEKKRLLSSKTAIDFKIPQKQLPLLRRREFKKPGGHAA
jgi:hypothetical protein